MRRLVALLCVLSLSSGIAAAVVREVEPAPSDVAANATDDTARRAGPLASLAVEGDNLIRLMGGAFDPLEGIAPVPAQIPAVAVDAVPLDVPMHWLVQAEGGDLGGTVAAVEANGGAIDGFVADAAYVVRATRAQVDAMVATPSVRAATLYQPGYKVPLATGDFVGLLDLEGEQSYRVYVFETEPDPAAVRAAVTSVSGATLVSEADRVLDVRATSAQVPAIAAISGVEWIEVTPEFETLNAEARWVNDTGERDEFMATAPGRLTGAGQTAGVADTDVNYLPDFSSGAQSYFRDCEGDDGEGTLGDGQTGCLVAKYTQANGGNSTVAVQDVVDNGTDPRKVVAYFDIGDTEGISGDNSNHGTHVAGSVTGDTDEHGTWDRADGMAPAAHLVHQNIGTATGGLSSPTDDYQLWAQSYRPSDPASVATEYDPTDPEQADHYADYVPEEDARTHNNSYGLVAPIVDLGNAVAADEFVWEHEDMFIVASAGNEGPDAASISAPSIGKNVVTSGASANGRQEMASIDSMAIFSSHGPSADGAYEVDLVTPGQIVVSAKGGTADEEHYLQGTSMSGPVLTGLATLVRQYFYDGYGPSLAGAAAVGASATGIAAGAPAEARRHNPSAALVRATLVNGADRMRGRYTGTLGSDRTLDGEYPSAGQGFGLVNLEQSLYFNDGEGPASQQATWYHDVWRADEEAFGEGVGTESREYPIEVAAGAPFSVSMVFTDAPSSIVSGAILRVNDLDLVVEAPDGTTYYGNNFNTEGAAGATADDYFSLATPVPVTDDVNVVERVRIPDVGEQPDGPWIIRVEGTRVAMGPQGFALAASGPISEAGTVGTAAFAPAGPARQVDIAGDPTIVAGSVQATSLAADLARVTWETSEPTTGVVTATVGGTLQTYIDSYNLNEVAVGDNEPGYEGITEAAPVETSEAYADRPVVSTHHEVLVTGLTGGRDFELTITSADLAGGRPENNENAPVPPDANTATTTTSLASTDAVYGAQPGDMAMLTEAPTDVIAQSEPVIGVGDGAYGTSTQLYTGQSADNGYLGAFMFRIPDEIEPSEVLGAAVEMTSGHDVTSHYADDTRLFVDLLPQATHEPIQEGGATYTSVRNAPAVARLNAETGYRRGGGKTYTFSFECQDLAALRETLSGPPVGGNQLASFRFDSFTEAPESLFSMEFGFNRRSRGADLRPRLVLFLEGETAGQADAPPRACNPDAGAPVIQDIAVQPALPPADFEEGDPGSVIVSWRTDEPSDSTVLYRPLASDAPFTQVGSDSLTTVHAVQVSGLDPTENYMFGVRSTTCNGMTTTDDNGHDGYSFGPVSGEVVEPEGPPPVPTEDFFFHGTSLDQANKVSGSPTATFDTTPPTETTADTQQSTVLTAPGTPGDASSIYWSADLGDEPRAIVGGVTFDWWFSTANAVGEVSAVTADVNVFADGFLVGSEEVEFAVTSTPAQFEHTVEVDTGTGPVDDELIIQVSPVFVDTGPGLQAHYDAVERPSGFSLPISGPVAPPASSGERIELGQGVFDFEDSEQGWVAVAGAPDPVTTERNEWVRAAPGRGSGFDFKVEPPYVDNSQPTLTSPSDGPRQLVSEGGDVTVEWFNDRYTEPLADPLVVSWSNQPNAGFTDVGSFPGPDSSVAGYGVESVTIPDVPAGPLYIRFTFAADTNITTIAGLSLDDVLVTQLVEEEAGGPVEPPGEPGDGTVDVEPNPVVGPRPAASANNFMNLDLVGTRSVPSAADVAGGTARCAPETGTTEPVDNGGATPPGGIGGGAPPGGTGGAGGGGAGGRARGRGPETACDGAFVPPGALEDIAGDTHEANIRCIAWYLITLGVGDADGDGQQEYAPGADVTRQQMASFILRLAIEGGLVPPANPPDAFEDDETSVHEGAINAAAAMGLVLGKGDLDGDGAQEFDPGGRVTRGQMAAFIARVHQRVRGSLPTPTSDHFEDDDGTTFAASIGSLAELRVVTGVGDRDSDGREEFDPEGFVTRAQMATFIANELGLLVVSGDAEPGGSEVYLVGRTVGRGGSLNGDVETNKVVGSLTADGCGLDDAPVTVGADGAFSVQIPATQPAGACELALRAVTNRAGEAGAGQAVTYLFDLTIT